MKFWECLFSSKNCAWRRYRKKAPNGQKNCIKLLFDRKAAERPKTNNNPNIFIQIFLEMFHYLSAAFRPFGRRKVGRIYSFGLLAMWPFLGQKLRNCFTLKFQIKKVKIFK